MIYTPEQADIHTDDGLQKMHVAGQAPQNDWTRRIYTETVKTTVVTKTAPARILARNDITLSGHVTNDKSVIVAGGTLGGQTGDIDNIDVKGETTVHRRGISTWHSTKTDWKGKRSDTWSHSPFDYDLPATHFDLNLWQTQADTALTGGSNPAQGQNVKPVSDLPGSVAPLPGLPDNALYQPATAPGSPYLIATDPAYTNYRNFLSSDYLLSRLSLDPAAFQKRLGDGYYERRLINEQILQKTGRTSLGNHAAPIPSSTPQATSTTAARSRAIPGLALRH